MFVAGLLAGAVGYLVSSPVYQVKTLAQARLIACANGVLGGKAPRYASLVQGLGTLKRDGHLWRGAGALVVRGALLSAGMQVRLARVHAIDATSLTRSAHCAGRLRRLQDLGESGGACSRTVLFSTVSPRVPAVLAARAYARRRRTW